MCACFSACFCDKSDIDVLPYRDESSFKALCTVLRGISSSADPSREWSVYISVAPRICCFVYIIESLLQQRALHHLCLSTCLLLYHLLCSICRPILLHQHRRDSTDLNWILAHEVSLKVISARQFDNLDGSDTNATDLYGDNTTTQWTGWSAKDNEIRLKQHNIVMQPGRERYDICLQSSSSFLMIEQWR